MYIELLTDFIDNETYSVKNLYNVKIDANKRIYKVSLSERYMKYFPIIRQMAKKYPLIKPLAGETEITFNNIYEMNIEAIKKELENADIDEYAIDNLSELIFWESINLSRLAPLIYDKNLDEIFINGVDFPIYVEHRDYSVLKSNISLTNREVNSLIRLAELIKGEGLLITKGNLETYLSNKEIHFRINIDSPPLTHGSPSISLRNLRKSYYSILELISRGSITLDMASMIILSAYSRLNILIAGKPNTGKTTLLNTIISIMPAHLRKLFIEEAREAIDLREEGNHQVFYKLSSIWENLGREKQVIFSLRRNPGYLIIGETLSRDDVKTLFYSLSLGLKVATTIHADSIESLMRRWLIYEDINIRSLEDLDLILFMEKELESSRRYIEGIYEINIIKNVPVFNKIIGFGIY